jgi:hypothetical protein
VPPVPHDRLNLVAPYLGTLRDRSESRSKSDPGLVRLTAEMARLKKNAAEKSISLNEAERRQEIAVAKGAEQENAREPGLRSEAKVYEITLQNATRPGLPNPLKPEAAKTEIGSPQEAGTPMPAESDAAVPTHDVVLHEATRILADYIGLLG